MMMQTTQTIQADQASTGLRLVVSPEIALYIVFLALAVVLRLPEMDTIPLNAHESREALAAYRALNPAAPGDAPLSSYPLMAAANTLTMAIGGAENVSARFATAVMGVLLVGLPLLFRRWIGPAGALISSGLLALSPVLLTASRGMDGAVWSAALALITIWCGGRFWESNRVRYGIATIAVAVVGVVAAEPAGFLTFAGIGIGVVLAIAAMETSGLQALRRGWPWVPGLAVAGMALLVIGTVFLARPEGMASIGEAFGAGLRGLSVPLDGAPGAFPLLVSLVYEPGLWVFGLAGAYFVLTTNPKRISTARAFIGRALVGWLIASIAWSVAYAGGGPGHALWLTLPLTALSAMAIERTLSPVRDTYWHVPSWGPLLHSVAMVAILFIAGINLLFVGRAVLGVAPALTPALDQPDLMKLFMVFLAGLLGIITFFLVGSLWGARAAWHGLGIGVLAFLLMYNFNAGWSAAITRADDPRELWHIRPASRNLSLLESTLRTASLRATGQPYAVQMVVQLMPGMGDDSPLAWTLRHFTRVTFVDAFSAAVTVPVVIGPAENDSPSLGASYVGQRFATYFDWDSSTMSYWDFVPWLYDRQTRVPAVAAGQVIVWVRTDVYGLSGDAELPGAR